jgi:segregation and condensation protein A
MLLPEEVDLNEEIEDPRKELVDQLIEYQKYKRLSNLISEKDEAGDWAVERKSQQIPLPFDDDEAWEEVAVWDLLTVFSNLMSSISMERIVDLYEEVSINEKITLIREYIETKRNFFFSDLIGDGKNALEIICAFLALLELVKQNQIRVFQNKLFGDIKIEGRLDEVGYGG